jgi:hypothetical protein
MSQPSAGAAARGLAVLQGFVADPWHAPPEGPWRLTVRPGPKPLAVQLASESPGLFNMTGAGAMAGHYAVQEDRLVVMAPDDRRMAGLAWAWSGDELVLVAEPSPPPTGAKYLGAKLRFLGAEQKPQ